MKISIFFSIVNPAGVNPAISYTWILQIRLILASQTTAAPPHHPYSILPKSLSPSRGHPHLHPTVNTILALTLSAPLTPSRLSPRPPNNRKTPRNNFPTHPYQQSPATFLEQEDGAGTPSQHPIPSQEQQGFRDTDLATSTLLSFTRPQIRPCSFLEHIFSPPPKPRQPVSPVFIGFCSLSCNTFTCDSLITSQTSKPAQLRYLCWRRPRSSIQLI